MLLTPWIPECAVMRLQSFHHKLENLHYIALFIEFSRYESFY